MIRCEDCGEEIEFTMEAIVNSEIVMVPGVDVSYYHDPCARESGAVVQ